MPVSVWRTRLTGTAELWAGLQHYLEFEHRLVSNFYGVQMCFRKFIICSLSAPIFEMLGEKKAQTYRFSLKAACVYKYLILAALGRVHEVPFVIKSSINSGEC